MGEHEEFQDFHEVLMSVSDSPLPCSFGSREPGTFGCIVFILVADFYGDGSSEYAFSLRKHPLWLPSVES